MCSPPLSGVCHPHAFLDILPTVISSTVAVLSLRYIMKKRELWYNDHFVELLYVYPRLQYTLAGVPQLLYTVPHIYTSSNHHPTPPGHSRRFGFSA